MHTVEAGRRIVLKNILFATDFSPCSNAALPYALSVGRRYGATLHAAHVRSTHGEMLMMSPECWPALIDEEDAKVESYLDQLEKELRDVPHDVLTANGDVPIAITQIIEKYKIDLLVLGTHGRAGVGKFFTGSIAEEVFRRASCPVLSIGPHVTAKPSQEIQFQHILFATDFSKDSLAALSYAVSFAEEDQSQLALLHVVEPPAVGFADPHEVQAKMKQRLEALVPPDAQLWCKAEPLVEFGLEFGPAALRILEVAKERAADLIVLGAHPPIGKLGLATHLASTTAQILTQATCPVLTVRGEWLN